MIRQKLIQLTTSILIGAHYYLNIITGKLEQVNEKVAGVETTLG